MELPGIDTKNLQRKAVHGAGWSAAAKFFRQFIQLFFQIILARMLAPSDFGLLSMVIVFSALADILKNLGLGAAIIQRQDITARHLSSVFWVNIFSGLLVFLLFQLLAPFIADFYKVPSLENVTKVYAFIYLIGSANVVQEAILQKKLQFKRLFIAEALAVIAGGVVALILAVYNYGVWTLVWQYLSITIISTIVLWGTSDWRPSFRFDRKSVSDLRKFGANLVAHDLLSFLSRNIDNIFIGKYLGPTALGIYSRAYFLMLQPVNITSQVLARVMFPVLSRLQGNTESIRRAYLKSTKLVAFIVFPGIAYVFVMAKPLIFILLGTQWMGVSFILQVFCIYSLVDTIGVTTGWIYKSLGRTDIMFRWAVYSTIIIVIAVVGGLQWGIEGVAIAYTAGFLVFLWLPGWYFSFRLIELKISAMLNNLLPVVLITVLTGAAMAMLYALLGETVAVSLQCLVVFAAGFLIYLLLSFYWNRGSFLFFRDLLFTLFSKRKISLQKAIDS